MNSIFALTVDGKVGRLSHVVTAVEPTEKIAAIRDYKHSGGD